MDWLEREEEALQRSYERGEISNEEYQKELRELHREYRAQAQEAAEEAYRNEMDRW